MNQNNIDSTEMDTEYDIVDEINELNLKREWLVPKTDKQELIVPIFG